MNKQPLFAVLGVLVAFAAGGFSAPVSASNHTESALVETEGERTLPARGVSSSRVLSQYGEPRERTGPVGDPPISTWSYETFTVYFEGDLVITSVASEDHLPTRLNPQ